MAETNSTKEIELFISWVKLYAADDEKDDESIMSKPITMVYPVYLLARYPLSQCALTGE